MQLYQETVEYFKLYNIKPQALMLTCVNKHKLRPAAVIEAINTAAEQRWSLPGSREFNNRIINHAKDLDARHYQEETSNDLCAKLDKIISILQDTRWKRFKRWLGSQLQPARPVCSSLPETDQSSFVAF